MNTLTWHAIRSSSTSALPLLSRPIQSYWFAQKHYPRLYRSPAPRMLWKPTWASLTCGYASVALQSFQISSRTSTAVRMSLKEAKSGSSSAPCSSNPASKPKTNQARVLRMMCNGVSRSRWTSEKSELCAMTPQIMKWRKSANRVKHPLPRLSVVCKLRQSMTLATN